MANYKNQKTIYIDELKPPLLHVSKKNDSGPTEQFLLSLNWKEQMNVMSDLEPPEFMLWHYLLKWCGQKYYDFSPADLEINFGWSENSSRKYRMALEKKHYITQKSQNTYTFNAYPDGVEERALLKREKNREKREQREKK